MAFENMRRNKSEKSSDRCGKETKRCRVVFLFLLESKNSIEAMNGEYGKLSGAANQRARKNSPEWEKFTAIRFIANGTQILLKGSYFTKVPLSKISDGVSNFSRSWICDEI